MLLFLERVLFSVNSVIQSSSVMVDWSPYIPCLWYVKLLGFTVYQRSVSIALPLSNRNIAITSFNNNRETLWKTENWKQLYSCKFWNQLIWHQDQIWRSIYWIVFPERIKNPVCMACFPVKKKSYKRGKNYHWRLIITRSTRQYYFKGFIKTETLATSG